ncbi:LysM peptidoglycan-binding domain-containing protein [Clostridia bacterium]|nr:LysM peptidoglycan-binding domain-containing protein [Clostridia bacterium]
MFWNKRKKAKRRRIVIRISKAAFVVRVLSMIIALQLILIPTAYAINRVAKTDKILSNNELASIEATSYSTILVQKGDTLWDLVEENYSGTKDIREIIYFVKESNGIDSTIYPGQTLNIPIE